MALNGLVLRTKGAEGFVGELSERATGLTAVQGWQSGYLMASFTLTATRADEVGALGAAFNTWLAYDLAWRDKGTAVFNGLICQLELTVGFTRRRRSLIDAGRPLWNAVRAQYDNAGTLATTGWATSPESIARYGRIEKTLTETASSTQAIAEQFRDMTLAERAWPSPYAVAISRQAHESARLDVMACGYVVTADWQEPTVTIAGTDNVSDVIADLITTDCPELSIGYIEPNTLQVAQEDLRGQTPRQQIEHLVTLGDAAGNMYRAFVGEGGRFFYRKVSDMTPSYFLTVDGIRSRIGGSVIAATQVQPGIMRDMSYPVVNAEPGSVFLSGQDMLISEVRYRQGVDFPDLRTEEITDSDLFAAKL